MFSTRTKVAWAWLDRMLGRAPSPSPAAPPELPENMSDAQKERVLDQTYKQLLAGLKSLQLQGKKDFLSEMNRVGRRYGVDPKILMFYVIDGKNWPQMPNMAEDALRTMQALLLQTGFPSFDKNEVQMFDDLENVRNALVDLAMHVYGHIIPQMSNSFYKELSKQAKRIINVFRQPGDRVQPNGMLHLMSAFEKRLYQDRFPGRSLALTLLEDFK